MISLLSRELPILDIDTFPSSLSINWRYSLDDTDFRGQNVLQNF
ncbi:hypothetical protein [Mycoplasmopsis bovis]|nr:hypothetical protein [Mycoplasmopsis bovis]